MRAWVTTGLGFLRSLPLPSLIPGAGLIPYAVGFSLIAALLGYVYIEGMRAEQGKAARRAAELNMKISELSAKLSVADAEEDLRVARALDIARKTFAANPSSDKCKLTPADVAKIKSVLGAQ